MTKFNDLDYVVAFEKNGCPLAINNDENKVPENEMEFIENLGLPSECQL